MHLHIDNMTCAGCVRGVTRAIQSIDADATVQAELPEQRIVVESSASAETIIRVLAEAGFPAQPIR